MIAWRVARLALHLAEGLLTCALVFPLVGPARRERLVRRWSARLLAICRITLHVRQVTQPAAHALIVSNHVSWLDIFAINALQPCRFVAKSDIRGWPLIGWLCAKTGTIFIARGNRRDVRRIYQGLVESLKAGERIAFFPEGTTAPQGTLLPFHANLFEAAIEAGVPVQPMALRYVDAEGALHPAADFIGEMTFAQSVMAILRAGRMRAELEVLAPMPTQGRHRRELAAEAHQAIGAALDERKNGPVLDERKNGPELCAISGQTIGGDQSTTDVFPPLQGEG